MLMFMYTLAIIFKIITQFWKSRCARTMTPKYIVDLARCVSLQPLCTYKRLQSLLHLVRGGGIVGAVPTVVAVIRA